MFVPAVALHHQVDLDVVVAIRCSSLNLPLALLHVSLDRVPPCVDRLPKNAMTIRDHGLGLE